MRPVTILLYGVLILARLSALAAVEPEPTPASHEHPADEEHHHGDGDDRHESPDSPCHHHDEHCPCALPGDGWGVTPSASLAVPVADGLPMCHSLRALPRPRLASCDVFHPPRA